MQEFLNSNIPNVMTKLPEFYKCILQTLEMVWRSGSISFVLGLFFGTVITVTKKGGILQNAVIYQLLDKLVNFFRSIPFIILLAGLIPLTRLISGTAIGIKGAIVPLVFGTVPFFTRQIETALAEIDYGLIEAAQSMGSSPAGIIFRIYLRESIGAITRVTTITAISLVGLTAMAGAVGAGGLGDFVIRYGHQRNQIDVTYVTIIVLVLFISIIQAIGTLIVKKSTH
ncbi:MAG TPA: methionine ABC transporter permease [Clostridia bacterium]|nr:methionine ABC transporter permease [Clostridia bacterium]